MQIGDTQSWELTFTTEDVALFNKVLQDRGIHQITPDIRGRLMVNDLLTATLPTGLGGDWNYVARAMDFEFVCPVFAGDHIHCDVTITHIREQEQQIVLEANILCCNQLDKIVLTGHITGIVRIPHYALVGLH